jgi:hypothetical protein
MKLETIISATALGEELRNLMVTDTPAFTRLLKGTFLFEIIFLILSCSSVSALFLFRPESIIWYILPTFLFVWSFVRVWSYNTYLTLFVTNFLMQYYVLLRYLEMSVEEREAVNDMFADVPLNVKNYISKIENTKV